MPWRLRFGALKLSWSGHWTATATSPAHGPYKHMTFQSLQPAGRQLETAPIITHTFFVSIVLISPVLIQCPVTMLSLSSSQTEPCYGRLVALHSMVGPFESVLTCEFRAPHLLLLYILYRKLPRFTRKLPNSKFRAGMFYLCSGPK